MLSHQVVDVYILWAAQWSHPALDLILSQFRKFILWENADWIKKKYILWKAKLSIAKKQKNVTNASPRFGGERLVLHFFDHFWARFFPCPSVWHFTHHATATVPCHSSQIRSTFNFFCTNKNALQLFWVDCSGGCEWQHALSASPSWLDSVLYPTGHLPSWIIHPAHLSLMSERSLSYVRRWLAALCPHLSACGKGEEMWESWAGEKPELCKWEYLRSV